MVKKAAVKKKAKAKPVSKTKKTAKKPVRKTVKKAAKKRLRKVSFIPKGYNSITPYLIVNNAGKAIAYYTTIFGAKEVIRIEHGGRVMHAELKIGDAKIMLADECPEMNARSPSAYGGGGVSINLFIKDVDSVVEKAITAGAKSHRAVETMFYGDRCGTIEDPFGHKWHVSTHVEDVTKAKMKKRAAELFSKKS